MSKILIVDDESNIRLMLRLALQVDGHEISVAPDGETGLEMFGDGAGFDLVLLDQRMPGLQGIDVLHAMKKRTPEMKIVMATAFGTLDLAREAMDAGASGFLRKPFTTDVLRAAINSVLAGQNVTKNFGEGSESNGPNRFDGVSVNGFRLEAIGVAESISRHEFEIHVASTQPIRCTIELPSFFIELVKAQSDRENLAENHDFWRWLGEEALANYLWQNSAAPPHSILVVDELTSNLKRWMDAVLIA